MSLKDTLNQEDALNQEDSLNRKSSSNQPDSHQTSNVSWNSNAGKDPLDRNVCICKKVTRRTVIDTIKARHLTSVNAIRCFTEANTSCGACYDGVKELLDQTLAARNSG
ncbi:MAG: (2Fe-2S)-binding protein [Marinobacterium sp.]|nr:(2Fe-2S)-binding protein [Marinobacterium sp.]